MEKDRKIHTQGTGKEENKVENIQPTDNSTAATAGNAQADVNAQGDDMNAGNEVTADIPVSNTDTNTGNTNAFSNNNTVNDYANEADVNVGDIDLDHSPGATNQPNNPSNADLATDPHDLTDDRAAVARSVDEDAEKQTGRPTGAIYGSGGEVITAKGFNETNDGQDSESNQ